MCMRYIIYIDILYIYIKISRRVIICSTYDTYDIRGKFYQRIGSYQRPGWSASNSGDRLELSQFLLKSLYADILLLYIKKKKMYKYRCYTLDSRNVYRIQMASVI